MGRIKIYKDDIPLNRPCHVWIERNFNLLDKMKTLTPKYDGKKITRLSINFDTDKLLEGINAATEKYKWWGWINKNQNTKRFEIFKLRRSHDGVDYLNRGSYYGGWSIKSNPVYTQSQGLEPENAGMGELPSPVSWFLFTSVGSDVYKKLETSQQMLAITRIAVEYGYKAVIDFLISKNIITHEQSLSIKLPKEEKLLSLHKEKDSYFDTWSFTEWSNAAIESGIKDLTDSSNCQLLRSRVAWQRGAFRNFRGIIKETNHEDANDRWTWHSDEPVVHNTRLVIPVQTSKAYAIEIVENGPRIPEKGYAYTWDTNIVHRQIQIDNSDKTDRIFIVLGFNPWFNWLPNERAWESNDFYGKVHPLDMLYDGLILPGVKFDKVID